MPFSFPPSQVSDGHGLPSSQPSVGASPYVYSNGASYSVLLVITGGTVTLVERSRNLGVDYFAVGALVSGEFIVPPGDKVRITYAVAPTVTVFPL